MTRSEKSKLARSEQKWADDYEFKPQKGTYWNYWNPQIRGYDGPQVGPSIVAYSTWSNGVSTKAGTKY